MKHDSKEKMKEEKQQQTKKAEPIQFEQLLDSLLQQKDQLFEEVFLTEDDKKLIDAVGKEHRDSVREALLNKGVLVKKLIARFQRLSADYANFQKRAPRQIADTISYEKERIIKSLLPVLDNFVHTLANTQPAGDNEVLLKGIRIIYDQMLDILKLHGAERIKAVGEKFDPACHEAMLQQSRAGYEDNVVLEEFQAGYMLNGRVIRPSKVIVNKAPSEQPGEEGNSQAKPAQEGGEAATGQKQPQE